MVHVAHSFYIEGHVSLPSVVTSLLYTNFDVHIMTGYINARIGEYLDFIKYIDERKILDNIVNNHSK